MMKTHSHRAATCCSTKLSWMKNTPPAGIPVKESAARPVPPAELQPPPRAVPTTARCCPTTSPAPTEQHGHRRRPLAPCPCMPFPAPHQPAAVMEWDPGHVPGLPAPPAPPRPGQSPPGTPGTAAFLPFQPNNHLPRFIPNLSLKQARRLVVPGTTLPAPWDHPASPGWHRTRLFRAPLRPCRSLRWTLHCRGPGVPFPH